MREFGPSGRTERVASPAVLVLPKGSGHQAIHVGICSFSATPALSKASPLCGATWALSTKTFGAVPWILFADSLLNFLLVLHVQEENTVFVMTNVILTLNQHQGRCPEVGTGSALILPCVCGSVG